MQLAQWLSHQAPTDALRLVIWVTLREPNDPELWLIQGRLRDRLGQRRECAEAMLAVLNAEAATDEQRLQAAHMLIRFDASGTALRLAAEAYERLGRPLAWASAMLYIAQRGADLDLAERLAVQLHEAYAREPIETLNESPRTHLNACGDESRNLAVIRAYRRRNLPAMEREPPAVTPLQGRRLRLGYLSSDYRDHPTARLLLGLLRHHDRTQFEIRLYCSGWDDGSAIRRELLAHADALHGVAQLSDADAAGLMREHALDILIDVSGLTRANRLGILAHRPAPVQIGYLAWPGSYGGDLVDYLIADGYVVPPERSAAYPEQIIRLAGTYQVNDHRHQPLPKPPARRDVGLPEGKVWVLGMFNAIAKVHRGAWDAWMKILVAVPNAVLWLLDPGPGAVAKLIEHAQRHGVDPRRLILAPRLPHAAHQARLACCDLMLDPWPYGGHTTTSDALAAGVPVVALEGHNFAGRVSGSLLRAAGIRVFIQPTVEAYVALVIRLLSDPQGQDLRRARRFLIEKRQECALFDAPAVARQLEQAYRQTLTRHLAGAPPEDITCEWPDMPAPHAVSGADAPPAAARVDAPEPAGQPPASATTAETPSVDTHLEPDVPPLPDAAPWAANMLVIDPCLQATLGHYQVLDEALYLGAQANGWSWTVLTHRQGIAPFPITPCFRAGGHVWGRDWLDWQQRTLALAASFAADLTEHVTPRLAGNSVPGLLLPSTTLPLLIGLVRWLETLPETCRLPYLGLHFHAEPTFGQPGSPMAAQWGQDAMTRLQAVVAAGKLAEYRFTVEHDALIAPWEAAGLSPVTMAPSPHAWQASRRQRPRDERLRLLFIGGMRQEKGIQELLKALPTLLRELPQLDVRLVASVTDAKQKQALTELAGPRVSMRLEADLPSSIFYQEMADADAVYCAYRPGFYAHKASGIFQEAQALGVPALITAGTGAAQDLDTLGGGAVVIPTLNQAALIAGCRDLIAQRDALRQRATEAAPRYAERKTGVAWWQRHTRPGDLAQAGDSTASPPTGPVSTGSVSANRAIAAPHAVAMPRVSFITTCKHRLHHLQQTLPLLIEAGADEIIVVDYGCPQQTRAWVAEHYPQVKVVHVDDDPGFNLARARNLGAAQATGDWLVMIDADICIQPGWLAWQREHLTPHCFYRAAPVAGKRDKETWGTCICPRRWFERLGGYDEAFQGWGGEDDDLYRRLVSAGLSEASYPSTFVSPIRHGDDERVRYSDIKALEANHVINHLYIAAKQQAMQVMAPGRRSLRQPGLADRQAMMATIHKAVTRWVADPSQPMAPITFQAEGLGWSAGTHRLRLRAKCEVSMVSAASAPHKDTSS
ncbi:glycosyltransferase [Halomonas campisalis]|uniref:Glycosyltransferase n=1 Tax=Billgrantia campisalis TaxID=74661 RepID=A0ABS9PDP0_9GAMM|nr:glycosyltransferase [Halomonas campisalis]MCG6659878.1 glycosyltransferase [Halomonas campisalis]MDR5865070.1 glycosyltransferase [Halomonas campisalis]